MTAADDNSRSEASNPRHVVPRARSTRRWVALAVGWYAIIAATSSTVILPADFFSWLADHVFSTRGELDRFIEFWGLSWFVIVKSWHMAEFAILCALAIAMLDRCMGRSPRSDIYWAVLGCAVLAAFDEYHQSFVPQRGATWMDVGFDVVGISVAGGAAWWRRRA